MKRKHVGFIVSVMMMTSYISAQQNLMDTTWVYPLHEVEIRSAQNQQRISLTQPVAIARLGKMELKRSAGVYLDDAINTSVPGVYMVKRTVGAGQQFNIRGYGNGARGTNGVNSNFDGQGYKVYLNGIPVTDAEGITLMDDIDFNSIGNVEILKGPMGTQYGLAIAGVVKLNTIRPEPGKTSISQEGLFGTDGLLRLTSRFESSHENASWLINYGHQEYDGFTFHTASHKNFVNVLGEFRAGAKSSVGVYAGYSNSYDQRNGELTIDQWLNDDYYGNPAYIKNDAHSHIISFRAGVRHSFVFNEKLSNTTTVFGTGISNNVSSAGGWTDKDPVNYGAGTQFHFHLPLGALSLFGNVGGEAQQQFAHTIGYAMVANPDTNEFYNIIGAVRSNVQTRSTTGCFFTEWILYLPQQLSVTAGLGASLMSIRLDDRFYVANNPNPTRYEKNYGNMVSPHVAVNKILNDKYSVYASYSTGYKAPVSSYFFIPATGEVNTNLKPEHASQIEIGTKGNLLNDRFYYEIAAFLTTVKDKMTTVAVPLDPPDVGTAYSYIVNRGSYDNKGLELLTSYNLSPEHGIFTAIRPFLNLAYSDFKYKSYTYQTLSADKESVIEVDYSGKKVAGVAPLTFNLGVDIRTSPGMYLNANYSYRDAIPFTSDGVNVTEPFSLVNAKLGYQHQWNAHWSTDLYVGGTNLTGEKYFQMIFLNQLPDSYLAAPPDPQWYGGVNLKYSF